MPRARKRALARYSEWGGVDCGSRHAAIIGASAVALGDALLPRATLRANRRHSACFTREEFDSHASDVIDVDEARAWLRAARAILDRRRMRLARLMTLRST